MKSCALDDKEREMQKNKLKHAEEVKALKKQQMQTSEALRTTVLERENLRETDRILLNTFDMMKIYVDQVKGQNKNPWCTSCGLFQETQSHILQCPELVKNLQYLRGKTSKRNENFVYGSLVQQEMIVKMYRDILEVMENLQHNAC